MIYRLQKLWLSNIYCLNIINRNICKHHSLLHFAHKPCLHQLHFGSNLEVDVKCILIIIEMCAPTSETVYLKQTRIKTLSQNCVEG